MALPLATSSSSSSNSRLWLVAVTAVAAVGAGYVYQNYFAAATTDLTIHKTKKKDIVEDATTKDGMVRSRFEQCVQHMGKSPPTLPQSTQLAFYGLYKQATVGDAPPAPPPRYDLVKTAKYNAWRPHVGTAKSAAMQMYIDRAVLHEFTQAMTGDDESNDGLEGDVEDDSIMNVAGMGMKPSTLIMEQDDENGDEFPLHHAARKNNTLQLEKLLQEPGASPDALDTAGQTALHLAADSGHPECIKLLFKYGANVKAADHDGISVLQAAVIGGNVHVCKLLCSLGADPDQPDRDGDTPRNCAEDDPQLTDVLFRASQGTIPLDDEFQKELQALGRPVVPLATRLDKPIADEEETAASSTQDDLLKLDNIPIELDDDGDMM